MVKKIGGKPPKKTTAVEGSKSIKTTGVDSSSQVEKTDKKTSGSKVSGRGQALTYAERERLLKLVTEEAEKMFPKNSSKKKTIEEAVKMAIDASIVSEDEEKS